MTIHAEIQSHVESFRLYNSVLQEILSGPAGPVARDLAVRALRVESAAKQNASQPHRAGPNSGSAPGGGPAVRTGRLRASITWRFAGAGQGGLLAGALAGAAEGESSSFEVGLAVEIGSNVEYARYVELGTSRMAARPYLVPALDAARG